MSARHERRAPTRTSYDVVIVGGAIYGSAVAWFLSDDPDFDGRVLVVERDPSYELASTSHTNSCMRQQFSNEINVRVSQFAAEFVKDFPARLGGEPRVPEILFRSHGYLYLAADEAFARTLREAQRLQARCGAGTRTMTPDEILRDYPFINVEDIVAGNLNTVDEGWFDGAALFDGWRRSARERGVEYVAGEVVSMTRNPAGTRVQSVTLATGERIACGTVVNASGPRAARTAAMAGIELPVEPRKRYSFVFRAEAPLARSLPLTIDPSGVHVRSEGPEGGATYLAGCPPEEDPAVEPDDFVADHALWEEKVWPALAHRVPRFEAIRLESSWVGHYAYNVFDRNAVLGRHTRVENFLFVNGFSGHGLQQSPAMGRGTAELIVHGEYRTLDLSPFDYARIPAGKPFVERAVI